MSAIAKRKELVDHLETQIELMGKQIREDYEELEKGVDIYRKGVLLRRIKLNEDMTETYKELLAIYN